MTAGPAPGRAADPVRTVFFGSGPFAVPILDAVAADPRLELVGVVTAPDRPAGRGRTLLPTPVALRARTMWAPLLQPARLREPDAISRIAELRPALGVLADYGQIVPAEVLELPALGILNIHPSLLPRHRGASPIPATIAAGDAESGVTIMRMDTGLDTGPIVAKQAWPTTGRESAPDLEGHAAQAAAGLLGRTLDGWLAGEIRPEPQPETGATLTRRLRRADAVLDPARSAAELERRVRAHVPWPGSTLTTPAGGLTVHRASVAPSEPGDESGTLVGHGDGLALATADGRLVLDEVQLGGRRRLSGAEFLRGQRDLLGTKVGAAADTGATAQPASAETATTSAATSEPATTEPASPRAVRA
jgi:methionyl-tRNA formyltransferase